MSNNQIILRISEATVVHYGIQKVKFEYIANSAIFPYNLFVVKLPKKLISRIDDRASKHSTYSSVYIADRYLDLHSYQTKLGNKNFAIIEINLVNVLDLPITLPTNTYVKIKNIEGVR